MNQYVTGTVIKRLREERHMTQSELAEQLHVSDKAVSKWETGKGYPDITLIHPLAKALGISVIELLSGNNITNRNPSSNMLRSKFYVCPICGNVMSSTGEAVISCCGITLPALEAEPMDEEHSLEVESVEDEYYITGCHEMTKEHYLSFLAAVSDNGIEIIKLYPEGNAEARVKKRGVHQIYCYCNRHGFYKIMPESERRRGK